MTRCLGCACDDFAACRCDDCPVNPLAFGVGAEWHDQLEAVGIRGLAPDAEARLFDVVTRVGRAAVPQEIDA